MRTASLLVMAVFILTLGVNLVFWLDDYESGHRDSRSAIQLAQLPDHD